MLNNIIYPKSKPDLRNWLENNLGDINFPLWIVIYKKTSGKQVISYEDVVETAIAFGLIDTQTKTIDAEYYSICLRQRLPGSNWTAQNIKIATSLISSSQMNTQGLRAFKARKKSA